MGYANKVQDMTNTTAQGVLPLPQTPLALAQNAGAIVYWAGPSDVQPASYQISSNTGSMWRVTATGPSCSASIVGLANGVSISFSIQALNQNNVPIGPTISTNTVIPNNPQSIDAAFPANLPSPIAWWTADSLGLGNGVSVNTWTDASGNGFGAAKVGTAPVMNTAWANGNNKNAVTFAGAGGFASTFTPQWWPSQSTVFVVGDITGAGNYQFLSNAVPGGGTLQSNYFIDTNAGNIRIQVYGDVLSNGPAQAQNAAFVLSLNSPGSSFNKGTKFGGQPFGCISPPAAAYPSSLTQGLYLGAHPVSNKYLVGTIAQVIVMPFLNTAQRQAIEAYLGTKYNVTMTQASNP